jgi:hypothetical protein
MLKRDIDILSKTILNKCGGIFNLAFLSKKDNFDNTYDPLTVRTFYVFSKKKIIQFIKKNTEFLENSTKSNFNDNYLENEYSSSTFSFESNRAFMPYIHITNDNYEIPSISPSYYFLGNSVISNNTSKVLVFSFNRKLVDVINSRSENLEKNTFDLPQIFDGSTFLIANWILTITFMITIKK